MISRAQKDGGRNGSAYDGVVDTDIGHFDWWAGGADPDRGVDGAVRDKASHGGIGEGAGGRHGRVGARAFAPAAAGGAPGAAIPIAGELGGPAGRREGV